MGCVPSKQNKKFRNFSKTRPSSITDDQNSSKQTKFYPNFMIRSRFLRKLKNLQGGLGVIYESPSECEGSFTLN
jgi:hypothetical protein